MPLRSLAVKDPKAVVVGDLNSDGRDDLVIATQTGIYQSAVYKLFVYLQTPEGLLSPPVEYPAGNSVSLAIADVNSDGRADLVCSTKKGFQVFLQEQSGTLAAPIEYISSLSGVEGGALLVADLTNDGRPDVAVVMSGPNVFPSIEIFQQTPEGALVFGSRYQAQGSSLVAGDFNSDGLVDILTPANRGFAIYRQLPGGGFAPPDIYTYPSGASVGSVAAGDVNGDGRDDVIVNQDDSFPTIGVWLQNSSGGLDDGPDYRAYQGATNLETGDFNGDGRMDLAVMNGSWQGLSLYFQKEDGSFADREIYPGPYSDEKQFATGDLNGDGQRDVVVLNAAGAYVFYHAPKNGDRIATVASFDGLLDSHAGASPLRELVMDQAGNFYGAAPDSGANGFGAIFRVTPDGLLTAVGELGSSTGEHPVGSVVLGNDGNFYGSTTNNVNGAHNGTLFRLTPGGTLTTLVQFDGTNGSDPIASLAKGTDGNFYGTTSAGGASGYGLVFKLTSAGAFSVLHHFDGTSGQEPLARLTQGHDGLLYGTTRQGGAFGFGTLFSISTNGTFTLLGSFDGSNGAYPY
ncbi:MAG TPA: choice-of-anchor tandem repeat GloVer-containing protein, partial [Chthoniobacterales bacterium]|nr:choice-of-anchor tandem repeat GloVer-containing protein [Chthoniobacterales bacterium]